MDQSIIANRVPGIARPFDVLAASDGPYSLLAHNYV